jgi:hypothetical protein
VIFRTGLIAVVLLATVAWFVPAPRAALDRVRFPRRTFGVERVSWGYRLDSRRGTLSAVGRTIPFRLPDEALDCLYDEAISSRLFDAGPLRRIERDEVISFIVPEMQSGVVLVIGSRRRAFAWTTNDWVMRDLHQGTWNRLASFSAHVDSVVHAQPAFRALPPSQFHPM